MDIHRVSKCVCTDLYSLAHTNIRINIYAWLPSAWIYDFPPLVKGFGRSKRVTQGLGHSYEKAVLDLATEPEGTEPNAPNPAILPTNMDPKP